MHVYSRYHTHTCLNWLVLRLFSFITYSRQNIMAIGFEAFMFSQSRRKFTNKCFSTEREHINASHHLACHSVRVSAMAKKLYKRFLIILLIKRIVRKRQLKMNLTVKMHCKIRKTSLNKLKTLQQLKRSNLLILRGPAEVDVTFWSKDGNLSWSSSPTEKKGRLSTENVIKMTPGLTKYATSRIEDIQSCFNLFLVISMTNLEGRLCSCGSVVRALR